MHETLHYSKLSKELLTSDLGKRFKETHNFIVSNYAGLSATDMCELRTIVRKTDATCLVVRNRLFKKFLADNKAGGLDELSGDVSGAVAVMFIRGDIVPASKALVDFSRTHEAFAVKAGFIDGRRLDQTGLKVLAELPSREVLLSMLLAAMQSPVSGFVGVLGGIVRKFLYALNAIKEKKGETN